jgi:hypothetical protein
VHRRAACVLLALALTSQGCGYALAGRGSFLPAYIRVVGIPPLENRTTFFQVEQILTEKIRTEFLGRGRYQVVPSESGVHAILSGAVTSITVTPIGFTDQQLSSRYLFTLTMRVQFLEAMTNMVLWSNESLTFREEVDLQTRGNTALEGATFLDQERTAFERISPDVARTVVSAILEAF